MTDKTDREILKIADYIEKLAFEMKAPNIYTPRFVSLVNEIRTAIHIRLAQQEQERREWKRLTDEEIYECEKVGAIHYQRHKCSVRGQQLTPADDPQWHFAGAIEAKLKEKND